MKEFVISEAKVEIAVLVGLITQTQDERKTNEYLDELAFLYFCTVWSQPTALADQRAPQYLPAERAMMYTTPMSTSTP